MASTLRKLTSSIKFTLGAPLLLLVAVLIGIILFSASTMLNMSSKAERVATIEMQSVATLADVSSALQSAYLAERSILTIKVGSEDYLGHTDAHANYISAAKQGLADLETMPLGDSALQQINAAQQQLGAWQAVTGEVFGLRDQDSRKSRLLAVDLSGGDSWHQFITLHDLLVATRAGWLTASEVEVDSVIQSAQSSMRTVTVVGIASALIALLVAVAMPMWLSRRLTQIQERILDIAHGDGDLTRRIQITSDDEIGAIAGAFNEFSENLRVTIVQTNHAAVGVARSAREICEHNNSLAKQAELQSEAVIAAASQLAQVATSISETSTHAAQVSQSARTTSNSACEGEAVIEETVSAMADVSESSTQIGTIISMVDSIAFQTNILALNAAVEAARAGEQGRGFAVVASEVRDLAQRSADAATDIKRLSETTSERVQLGSTLVTSSGERLRQIVQSIHDVSSTIDEISHATQGQNQGLQDVNTRITDMRDMMQSTTTFVREVADASAHLEEDSAELLSVVSRFKVQDGQAA